MAADRISSSVNVLILKQVITETLRNLRKHAGEQKKPCGDWEQREAGEGGTTMCLHVVCRKVSERK